MVKADTVHDIPPLLMLLTSPFSCLQLFIRSFSAYLSETL